MSETGSDSSKVLRYCGIPFCKNFRGTSDESVALFRVPPKNTRPWRVWLVNLSTNPGIRKSLENIQELCMLHFKPNDLELEMQNGKPIFTLKTGASPLPIKFHNLQPVDTRKKGGAKKPTGSSASRQDSAGQSKLTQDVKFIDVNEFLCCNVTVKSELIEDDELQPSTLNKLEDSITCSNCVKLSIQSQNDNIKLQKAKMRIKELEKEVVALMLKIQYLEKSTTQATQAIDAAVKVERPHEENITESHENKEITIVNIADITSKPKPKNISKAKKATKFGRDNKTDELNQEVSCKKCLETFECMEQLVEHLRIVNQHRVDFECFVCKRYTTRSEKMMRNHIRRHDDESRKKRKRCYFRSCNVCNESFGWCEATVLDSHLCGDKVDIQCEYCDDRFTSTKQLCEHLDSIHKTQRSLYSCTECVKIFAMSFLRNCHQASHTEIPERLFKCDLCPKKFLARNRLNYHKKTHASQHPHLCDECGKEFSSPQLLQQHKKSSAHSKPLFECPFCPKKFYHPSHLKRHSGIHSGTNYACDLCSKGFTTIDGYRRHKKRHNKTEADRRYACKYCPMKCFSATDLNKHEKSHSGIKKFHCRFCDQSYKYSGDLYKHLRIHYKDGKVHECSECKMRFKYSAELEKHSLEHYKEGTAVDGTSDQPIEEKIEDN